MKYIIPIILTLLSNVALASNEAETHLTAMLEKYLSLTSYEDYGHSITHYSYPDGSDFNDEFNFKTIFDERNSIYFDWTKQPNELQKSAGGAVGKPRHNAVWKDNTGIYSKYWHREITGYDNLAKALSSATGISSGLAWMIPRYLSPDIPCPPNLGAKSSELLESDSDTIVIKQTHANGGESKLFIDATTYLLMKYEMKYNLETGMKTHQVVVFNVIHAN